jgi:hypothetical protein
MHRLILPLGMFCAASLPAQSHIITHTYTVGGEGGWDYVVPDPPNHRLFIARSNRLMVVDMNDGHLIGEVMGRTASTSSLPSSVPLRTHPQN